MNQESPAIPEELRVVIAKIGAYRRLDLRWIDETERTDIKRAIERLYLREKLSTTEIAIILGKSPTCAWKLCRKLGIELRSPDEGKALSAPRRIITLRKSFSGSKSDVQYLKGFSEGDLDVRKPSTTAVMISSTTTHPAFTSCFRELFQNYGPIYEYPTFDKMAGYRWKVATRLDNSFSFLLPSQRRDYPTITESKRLFFSWLSGIVDTEGSIVVQRSGAYIKLVLLVSNQDQVLLRHIKTELSHCGYHPTGPYLRAREGDVTRNWKIGYTKDMWQLSFQRARDVKPILKLLPLRHEEKILRKELALTIPPAARWEDWGGSIVALRSRIKQEVSAYVLKAQEQYKMRDRGKAT